MPSLLDAFEKADQNDKPTLFLCYTIKGSGLPLAGHKDNHAGLLTPEQMAVFQKTSDVRAGHEWDKWEGAKHPAKELQNFVDNANFFSQGTRRLTAPKISVPERLDYRDVTGKFISTQMGFGQILNEISQQDSEFSRRIVTTSPDVTVSTNLGAWINRRGLFAKENLADTFKAERIPSTFNWNFSPAGQHIELGIAESNLFLLLSALGLSSSINGERLLPIGTVYDPFIYRAADQLNYACYQDARFMLVATPSGITLAPEGGAHQSIGTPLIGIAQDRLASFEPAFMDELALMMRFGFDFMQREGEESSVPHNCLEDETGGSIYLRLSTRPLEQPARTITEDMERDIIDGAYWMRKPTGNAEIIVAYTGAVAPEAIQAVGLMAEARPGVGLLAITSADRLMAGWSSAQNAREEGLSHARSHIERLFDDVPSHCSIITVCDSHPTTLSWLGSVNGHRTRALGVKKFGQTGTISDLYSHYGIDVRAILQAAESVAQSRPIRSLYIV